MSAPPPVTFLSDFGLFDWYVGAVHGVLLSHCPGVRVVDLTHEIPPADILRGALTLEGAAPCFPPGTVHLAVVDPGVGTARRALAVGARGQSFVGPDNGLLEWALSAPGARVHDIVDDAYFRHPVSPTFHGRDVFAPVAAAIAAGAAPADFGPLVRDPVRLSVPTPFRRGDDLVGRILLFDRFGNAITNLPATTLRAAGPPDGVVVTVSDRVIQGLTTTFGDAPLGRIVAYLGSSGRLEIAQVGGDVNACLGLGVGDEVRVRMPGGRFAEPESGSRAPRPDEGPWSEPGD